MTEFTTQVGDGKYRLVFETDNQDYYLRMQQIARLYIDHKNSNYDHIQNMSIDKMAELLADEDDLCLKYCNKKCCVYFEDNGNCEADRANKKNPCVQAVKQWLKSEVSE